MSKEKLHKIDVGEKLLNTAIKLFFESGEHCAILHLATAAEEILGCYRDGEHVGHSEQNMFNRMLQESKRRGYKYNNKKEFSQQLVNHVPNALKHANKENEQFVVVSEEEIELRLCHALANFQLGASRTFSSEMNEFEAWIRKERPQYVGR